MDRLEKFDLILVTALLICSIIIFVTLGKEFPCTTSGCGCRDGWEMLADTWTGWQLVLSVILYLGFILKRYL